MFLLLGSIGLLVGAGPAIAQLGFTEFAVTDTSLNSSSSTDFWIASAAPADVDADGDLDLLVAGYFVIYPTPEDPDGFVEDRLMLYRNDGPAGIRWALVPIPVDAAGLSFSAADLAWGDYDGDGDPDVVVGAVGEMVMYRNDGGTLVRTTTVLPQYQEDNAFTSMDQRSLTWGDVDNDGDLDLLVPSAASTFEWLPTMLLRNDGPGVAGDWTFTDLAAPLPVTSNGLSAWADMDHDGDLDLLLGNVSPNGDNFLNTYRNGGGVLAPADVGLAFIRYGTAAWGDADNDGDLDVVYAGNMDLPDDKGETAVRILFNDGQGGYTSVVVAHDFGGPDMAWLDFSAVTWADYDSDGDLDLLVSGQWLGPDEIEGRALVFINNAGTFTPASEPLPAPIAGDAGGAFTWYDVDADGDLDYFVAGGYYVPGGNGLIEARTQLFRNDATGSNSAPTLPTALQASVSGNDVSLTWDSSTDDRTPSSALTYELVVEPAAGARIGGSGVIGRALPQPGNVSSNHTWIIRGFEPGTYTWSVRALDNAFNGGVPAQGSFQVSGTAGVGGAPPSPIALSAPHPNPFSEETRIMFTLERGGPAKVAVHDVRGRLVAVLHDGPLTAGVHALRLKERGLSSGIYFIRATAGGRVIDRRVTLLR